MSLSIHNVILHSRHFLKIPLQRDIIQHMKGVIIFYLQVAIVLVLICVELRRHPVCILILFLATFHVIQGSVGGVLPYMVLKYIHFDICFRLC